VTGPRPGGQTSRGLPYPGSNNIISSTPAAIQALAEAIGGQLSSIGSGIAIDGWAGNINFSAGKGDLSDVSRFPKLASIDGIVACLGTVPANSFLAGMGASVYIMGMNYRAAQYNGAAWVYVLAWGPAKPTS